MYTIGYYVDMAIGNHIGVRELRAGLATFIKRAEAGDRIIVTIDGRPTAQLGPLQPKGKPNLDDLIATGYVKGPRKDIKPLDTKPAGIPVDLSIDRILQELRGQ
ncbi:MAG: type II toxin-antitoxin system prevent-host-death family antitoxin [Actinomycetota bacterium]|nr:type II toxin-antitoxin system prevent-host-death family antitoxin [Actinomycetota bacterium]